MKTTPLKSAHSTLQTVQVSSIDVISLNCYRISFKCVPRYTNLRPNQALISQVNELLGGSNNRISLRRSKRHSASLNGSMRTSFRPSRRRETGECTSRRCPVASRIRYQLVRMIKGKKFRSLMALPFSGTTANVNKFICAAASRMHLNDRQMAAPSNCSPSNRRTFHFSKSRYSQSFRKGNDVEN